MENKEKIVLADGTEIEIETGASENLVQVIVPDLNAFKQLYEKFTEQNLSSYKITDADGAVFANLSEKYVADMNLKPESNGFLVSLHIQDVDKIKKAVDAAIDEYTEQLIEEGII